MPRGLVIVAGWCLLPALPTFAAIMLPGGMFPDTNGGFNMIVAGWAAFAGSPPI